MNTCQAGDVLGVVAVVCMYGSATPPEAIAELGMLWWVAVQAACQE